MTTRERRRAAGRQGAVRSALVIALAVLFAACGAPATSPPASSAPPPTAAMAATSPTRICEAFQMADPPPFSCTEVIGKVLLAMGPDAAAVKAAWFRPGSPCPPNARCMARPPGSAYVVVRLESGATGIFPVTFAGSEVAIGAVTEPTFDIWPPSGEAIPQVRRPAMDGAPAEVADRPAVPLCWDEGAGVFESPLARRCFLGAVQDGRPAELHSRGVDEADGPVMELYRFAGRGPVLVYQHRPKPANPAWVRKDCAIGPAFDDMLIFVVAECLTTELS